MMNDKTKEVRVKENTYKQIKALFPDVKWFDKILKEILEILEAIQYTKLKIVAKNENTNIQELVKELILEGLKKRGYVFVSEGDNL